MLELVDLRKRYGDVVALDGCAFTVHPGRLTGFLGPNGAGKTTAMRCVLGLVRPDGGQVRWRGRPVGPAERLGFGYMPEERGLYPRMRVAEQLAYFGRLSGMGRDAARSAARRWLERLGLAGRAGDRLEALSHGNQQRVQLATALLHDPELLVLDEPFAGLDPLAMDAMGGLLGEVTARGAAVLFSSHQLDLVEHLCEDVVIVDHGRVVLAGGLEELRTATTQRMVEVGLDAPSAGWAPRLAGVQVLSRDDGHLRLRVDRAVDPASVVADVRAAGRVTRLAYQPPSLSDLFREAVA